MMSPLPIRAVIQDQIVSIIDDGISPVNELQIENEGMFAIFTERTFTFNDLLKEIDNEKSTNGHTDRLNGLMEIKKQLRDHLLTIENLRLPDLRIEDN